MYVPNGCWVASCCSWLSVCRRGLVVLVSLQPFMATRRKYTRSHEPSVARESQFQKAKRTDVQYTINSPVQTTWMCFGWAKRRVVRGPQGPPCSSAPSHVAHPCVRLRRRRGVVHGAGGGPARGDPVERLPHRPGPSVAAPHPES
jgi:hypothetical protein